MRKKYDLDSPLIRFSGEGEQSSFTIRNSIEGLAVFGSTGTGKSTGSGLLFALKYLQHGYGGLVLTAKPDERDIWVEYCRKAGRENDLIIVEPGGQHSFDFLKYVSSNRSQISYVDNVFQILKTVINSSEEKSSGRSDDKFWTESLDSYILHSISLCMLAYSEVSVQGMYNVALTAPKVNRKREEGDKTSAFDKAFSKARENVKAQIDKWRETQPAGWLHRATEEEFEDAIADAIPDFRVLKMADQFFTETLYEIAEKTRNIIELCFCNFLFRLLREPVYSLFCKGKTTFTPEDCLDGKIILINLPVKQYHKAGTDCQILIKYIWQLSMEKRNVEVNGRPVFLWADEAQSFLHEHDAEYQVTARSSRIATVYITQNLHNYHSYMAGEKSDHKVFSFLGTLATKLFHCNNCLETNDFSAKMCGEAYTIDHSRNNQYGKEYGFSKGKSFRLEKVVRPEEFTRLKTGGPAHNRQCEAYIIMQGKLFRSGFNFKKVTFNQSI